VVMGASVDEATEVPVSFPITYSHSLGPALDACVDYLDLKQVGTFAGTELPTFKSRTVLQGLTQELLPHQVTAIVWILSRFLGELPPLKLPESAEEGVVRAQLSGPQSFGGIYGDTMGFGKTLATICALELMIQFHLPTAASGKHYPVLVLAPNSQVAGQWTEDLLGNTDPNIVKAVALLSSTQKKFTHTGRLWTLPGSGLHNQGKWPHNFRSVIDEDNPSAGQTIIVVPISLFRTTYLQRVTIQFEDDRKVQTWLPKSEDPTFSILVVDEAHRLKDVFTMSWKASLLTKATWKLLITANTNFNGSEVSNSAPPSLAQPTTTLVP